MELALWLLISTLVIQLIEYVGSDALASYIYTPFAPSSKSTKAKKAEILQLRADLAATSSQDEFSKWARIRRKLDKAVSELEATNSTSSAQKARFATSFKSAVWLATTIIPFVISSWNRKTPVIWLPKGWFGPLGWWLSFPSAPAGAVAVSIWTMACKRTLGSVKSAIYEFVPTPEEKTAQQFAKAQAQPAAKEKVAVGVKASGGEEKVKKEL
ncbi:GET complex subunit GET1 [Sporobolomyces salmoneus]|uniref:GET complex subunit GET1 n=1 Tax=Sporobolomyces salmoneus TaxID=183962 RepID=UPI00317AC14D